MGKWKKLKSKLPRFELEPEYRTKVDAAKVALLGTTVAEGANVARLARLFADRKRKKRVLEARIAALNVELEALSQLGIARQEDEETATMKLSGGLTVYVKDEPYTTVEDRTKAMRWAKAEGHLYLFQLQWQGLNRLVKDRLVRNLAPPPGTKVWMKSSWHVLGLGVKDKE